MDARPETGRRGEDAAARHLTRRGWRVIARRWRGGAGGELDLIAVRAGVLAICEVKARRGAGGDYAPVSSRQRERIVAGAEAFLAAHPSYGRHTVHLDLVLVRPSPLGWAVRHLPRALEW